MKKILLSSVFFLSTIFICSSATAFLPPPFPPLEEITNHSVPGTPFIITKIKKYVKKGYESYAWEYSCYLSMQPSAIHAGSQRLEYVGCQVAYRSSARYFQFFPGGGMKELRDMSQALYEPSKIILSPGTVGQYLLFESSRDFTVNGSAIELCLSLGKTMSLPEPWLIRSIHIWAGYGYLTKKDVEVVNQYKLAISTPEIKAQAGTILMDEETMKWAFAQGNMFRPKNYFKIFDINNPCGFGGF